MGGFTSRLVVVRRDLRHDPEEPNEKCMDVAADRGRNTVNAPSTPGRFHVERATLRIAKLFGLALHRATHSGHEWRLSGISTKAAQKPCTVKTSVCLCPEETGI